MLDILKLFAQYEDTAYSPSPAGTKVVDVVDYDLTEEILDDGNVTLDDLSGSTQLKDLLNRIFVSEPSRSVRVALVQAPTNDAAPSLIRRSLEQDVDLLILNLPVGERSDRLNKLVEECVEAGHYVVDIQST